MKAYIALINVKIDPLCSSTIYPHSSHVQKGLEFPEGWVGGLRKTPIHGGRLNIFWNYIYIAIYNPDRKFWVTSTSHICGQIFFVSTSLSPPPPPPQYNVELLLSSLIWGFGGESRRIGCEKENIISFPQKVQNIYVLNRVSRQR